MAEKKDDICHSCSKPIVGKMIIALGKIWHPEHFVCKHCNLPIEGDKFNDKDGDPYCEEDYNNLFLKKCAKCNQPITDKIIVALSKNWHQDHFVCVRCGVELSGQSFFEQDGQPYCETDYHQLFSPKCFGCNLPISDATIVALGHHWHEKCFICVKCGRPVKSTYFEVVDEKPVCSTCSEQ